MSANALFVKGSLTLIATTLPGKFWIESLKVHISFVHTPVKAPGKNANTVFLPEKEVRDLDALVSSGSSKSGSFCPTSIDNANTQE
jgi:hypothetical protein